ncbi:hypothetical protein GCK32_004877 [Trichostrongylus colubriformis]|uniref:Uncharacterized protein n=1 Tax=Trichostrongylus colubriformis TaxID=6319 RepID=A0AAN8IKQ9_TRICO
MFSEQYGRKDKDMSKRKSKSRDDEKSLSFDRLEDKLKDEMTEMSVKEKEKEKEAKAEMKYSPAVQTERAKTLTRGKTQSATVILQKEKNLMAAQRSSSLEKNEGESVSVGLFDAANVVCNIVEISKDSTLRRNPHHSPDAKHQKPQKKTSSSSLLSSSSNNAGPFALLKESERKKKQSLEDEEY